MSCVFAERPLGHFRHVLPSPIHSDRSLTSEHDKQHFCSVVFAGRAVGWLLCAGAPLGQAALSGSRLAADRKGAARGIAWVLGANKRRRSRVAAFCVPKKDPPRHPVRCSTLTRTDPLRKCFDKCVVYLRIAMALSTKTFLIAQIVLPSSQVMLGRCYLSTRAF